MQAFRAPDVYGQVSGVWRREGGEGKGRFEGGNLHGNALCEYKL